MRRAATLTFATTMAALLLSGSARANEEYVVRIPNGAQLSCENCHPGNNTLALNQFGVASANQSGKPAADWWPALRALDSDDDGQSNAQELGDPCHEWVMGTTPGRIDDISNPGDEADLSADPDSPPCDGTGGAGAGSMAGTSGAGTPAATTGAGAGPGAGAGGGGPGGGQGGTANASTGAGKANPLVSTTPGACATTTSLETALSDNLGGAAAFFAALALFLARPRGRRSNRK